MPLVIVKVWPGKTAQQKMRLAAAIAKDVIEVLHDDEASVSVAFEEVTLQDWAEKVDTPDMQDTWNTRSKKPGTRCAWHVEEVAMPLRMAVISWLALITTSWAQRDDRKDRKMQLFAASLGLPQLPAHLLTNNRKEKTMQYTAMLLSLSLLVSTGAVAGRALAAEANKTSQTISRGGSLASSTGPAEFFTGNVRIDPLFPANDSAHFSGAYVTFEPGARSAWHMHPTGQHLIVTAGVGRTQAWGGPIEEIKAGDVIWCPPQVKHWHGASPTTAMTHIAITGTINGKNVEWMEKVTDEQYHGK